MEHRIANRKLQRTTAHRLAMLRNMVTSLLEHEKITTTVPKAKEARKMAEKVITLGKKGGLHNVRMAERIVKNRDILQKVFGELKDRYAKRPGGYTRLMKAGFRKGDAADIAILELVDSPAKATATVAAPGTATAQTVTSGKTDDISLIGGIGPKIHKALTDLGVTTFAQIAAWSPEDVVRIEGQIKQKGRVGREEWIEQAKELMAGKAPRAKTDKARSEE